MTTKQKHLLDWIRENIASKGFSRFEDLHLDEVSDLAASPDGWFDAMTETCECLDGLRSELPAGYTICIGISLRCEETPIGITFRNRDELISEFTFNCPSIYVFETGTEPWSVQSESSIVLEKCTFPWSQITKCSIHFEYLAPYESEYRRSFWIVL
jgi:hypothetical protein